jgi:acyl carrier protein phosphodiesterase
VRRGVLAHRAIDRFTDAHPEVRRARGLVGPSFQRFSGILVDVFFDHFLALSWSRFSPEPLRAFAGRCYAALAAHEPWLPERLKRALAPMTAQDWLSGYAEIENIGHALRGLERRFKRPTGLSAALGILESRRGPLRDCFLAFFPALREFARTA